MPRTHKRKDETHEFPTSSDNQRASHRKAVYFAERARGELSGRVEHDAAAGHRIFRKTG